MRLSRAVVLAASTVLFFLLLSANSPGELARRANFMIRAANSELAVRRLEGSGAAFDREYFRFLETARRKLPDDVRGVAIYLPAPTTEALYLATYQLAPVPVRVVPRWVPPRWIAAFYRLPVPEGFRVLAPLPAGALASPR